MLCMRCCAAGEKSLPACHRMLSLVSCTGVSQWGLSIPHRHGPCTVGKQLLQWVSGKLQRCVAVCPCCAECNGCMQLPAFRYYMEYDDGNLYGPSACVLAALSPRHPGRCCLVSQALYHVAARFANNEQSYLPIMTCLAAISLTQLL